MVPTTKLEPESLIPITQTLSRLSPILAEKSTRKTTNPFDEDDDQIANDDNKNPFNDDYDESKNPFADDA